ncbi:FeoA family protein [Rivibacter subsaxonicus]|uniref:Ferrous iron transport protein A n=1 Tax=Rivibacter subsaxonicus TaxID=457575 RepID=A0A4Q7W0E7_9BURK|nr:FeoA family protein [Rivibacter subsaxonicus]RZU02348.1 ferrous iron transport protein A [Rivibacter subsaxonicus]
MAESTLDDVPLHVPHQVAAVVAPAHAPDWAERLAEIGFLPGENVAVTARGAFGGDPLVVRVGLSSFALRRAEAACVHVSAAEVGPAESVRA